MAVLLTAGSVYADRSWSPPDQTGHAGQFLETDGTNTLWAATSGGGSGGTIGGAVTGGTPNDVLFVDPSGNLGQNNNFQYTSSGGLNVKNIYSSFGPTTPPVRVVNGADFYGTDNTINGVQIGVGNASAGTSAYSFVYMNNNLAVSADATHYAGLGYTSSIYSDTTFGTAANIASQFQLWNTDGPLTFLATNSGTPQYMNFVIGGAATTNEQMRLNTTGLGLKTAVPTHTLTLGSTSTGIAYYNTTDQTTNFERVLSSWVSNVYTIATSAGGTGTIRNIALIGGNTSLTVGQSDPSGSGVNITRSSSSNASLLSVGSSNGSLGFTSGTGTQAGIVIDPTITQTSTAGYRGLWITPFESTTGSGSKFLIDAGTNSAQLASGTHTSKFSVDNAGNVILAGSITASGSGNVFGTSNIFGLNFTGTASVNISGVVSTSVASSTQGRLFSVDAGTLTRSADTGTIAQSATSSFGIPTLAAGAATTYTIASTVYIDGAPLQGTNATITNAAALYINTGTAVFNGGLSTGFPNTTSNFNVVGNTSISVTGTTPIGGQSINYRSLFNGQTSQILTVNDSYASMMIGANAITTAASGTHAIVANLAVVAPVITIGTAGITNAASLYVQAAPTGATNNYALMIGAGNVFFGGKLTTYNSITTAGYGIPAIYGSGRQTAQTAADASVATYTVGASDGSFWVSGNVNVTAFAVGTFNEIVTYTDETNTVQTLKLNFSSVTGTIGIAIAATGPFEGIPAQIRAKAGTAITISTTGTFTSLTYNVEGNITQVQ